MKTQTLANEFNKLIKEYRDEPLHFKDFSFAIHDKMLGLRTKNHAEINEAFGTGNELDQAYQASNALSHEIIANFI
jgi:hypothetical protein